jgi:hypothetical protein
LASLDFHKQVKPRQTEMTEKTGLFPRKDGGKSLGGIWRICPGKQKTKMEE